MQQEAPFTREQVEQLDQPLDAKRVKHRTGGGGAQLSYLKGHDIIDAANRIFGYGCWGYDLLAVELTNVADASGEIIGQYYTARIKLTVAGAMPITEEGICPVQEGRNPRAKIDAHDMSRKGAITDALKRALRCYGDQFGNSLYDNDLVDGQPRSGGSGGGRQSQPQARTASNSNGNKGGGVVKPQQDEAVTEQQRTTIYGLAEAKKISLQTLETRCRELFGNGTEQLTFIQANDLISKLKAAPVVAKAS